MTSKTGDGSKSVDLANHRRFTIADGKALPDSFSAVLVGLAQGGVAQSLALQAGGILVKQISKVGSRVMSSRYGEEHATASPKVTLEFCGASAGCRPR